MRKQEKAVVARWVIMATVLMVIVIIIVANFYLNSIEQAREDADTTFQYKAQIFTESFAAEITAVESAGKPMASLLGQRKYFDANYAQRISGTLVQTTGAYLVCCADQTGSAVDHQGRRYDLTEFSYYAEACAAANKYTYVKDNGITGQDAILITLPIGYENGTGHMFLYYPTDGFGEWQTVPGAFYLLLDRKGNILASSQTDSAFLRGENFYDTLDNFDESMSGKIKNRMKSDSNGTASANIGGEKRRLIFVASGIRDWRFMMGVDENLINKQVHYQRRELRGLLLQLSALLLLFVTILISVSVIGRIRSNDTKKELEDKADTDLLTGLNNKLATERKITEFLEKNPTSQSMLFLIDLDNFKTINDTMGHAFGDEVLRTLGKQLSPMFRVTDIVGRIGGDEFMVFVKNVNTEEHIYKEAKKVESFFRKFEVGEYVKYAATASIGVAIFPEEGANFEKLYKAADRAVYKAKERGKKQLAFYDDKWDIDRKE